MPSTGSRIIYHYCSLEAFKSIIENKCLWLCDAQKSNDSVECIHFINKMLEVIDEHIQKINNSPCHFPNEDAMLKQIKSMLQDMQSEWPKIYTCSFSYAKDRLSQWRGYADNAAGVSIGFDSNMLKSNRSDIYDYMFDYVRYDHSVMAQQCEDILENSILQAHDSFPTDFQSSSLWSAIFTILQAGIARAFYKNSCFYEEEECRIAFQGDPENVSKCVPFSVSELKHRTVDGQPSSYYEFSFASTKDRFIRKIYLGPKCKVHPDDIRTLLKDCGYQADNIDILPSETTYR